MIIESIEDDFIHQILLLYQIYKFQNIIVNFQYFYEQTRKNCLEFRNEFYRLFGNQKFYVFL